MLAGDSEFFDSPPQWEDCPSGNKAAVACADLLLLSVEGAHAREHAGNMLYVGLFLHLKSVSFDTILNQSFLIPCWQALELHRMLDDFSLSFAHAAGKVVAYQIRTERGRAATEEEDLQIQQLRLDNLHLLSLLKSLEAD